MIEDINDYIRNHPSNFESDIIEGIMEKYNLTEVVATQPVSWECVCTFHTERSVPLLQRPLLGLLSDNTEITTQYMIKRRF